MHTTTTNPTTANQHHHSHTHTHTHTHTRLLPFSSVAHQDSDGEAVGWSEDVPGGEDIDLDAWKTDPLTTTLKKDAKDAGLKFPKLSYLCEFFSIVKDIGPGRAFSKAHAETGARKTGVYPFNAQLILETCAQFKALTKDEQKALEEAYLHIVALFADKGEATESEYDAVNVVKDKDVIDGIIRDELTWWRHRAEIVFSPKMRAKRAEQREAAAEAQRQKVIDNAATAAARAEEERVKEKKRAEALKKAAKKREDELKLGAEIAGELEEKGWDVDKVLKKARTKGAKKDRIKSGTTLSALAVYLGYAGGPERVEGDTLQDAWMKVLDPLLVLKKGSGGGGGAGDGNHPKELYCLCQKPMDENTDEFWLGCEGGCDGWFHPQCVGLSDEAARALENFTCSSCAKQGVEEGEGEGEDEEENVQEEVQEMEVEEPAVEGRKRRKRKGRGNDEGGGGTRTSVPTGTHTSKRTTRRTNGKD